MSKKIILVLIGIVFFSSYSLAHASILINEIQLTPTSERFIELYNSGSSAVDLTNWYIQRKTQTGNTFGSLVSKPNFENKTIGARSYFIISRASLANSDIVLSDLTLTENNTIQIKNSKEEVVNKLGWGTTSDCDAPCPPNPSSGQSIQRTANGWLSTTPTPRGINENQGSDESSGNSEVPTSDPVSNTTPPPSGGSGGGGGSSQTTPTATKKVAEPKIEVKIVAKNLAFVGIPFSLQGTAFGLSGEKLYYGKYFWNFGDGDFKETTENTNFMHTYFYSGDYTISLEYYSNSYSQTPDAINKIIVKVVPLTVAISRVGDEKDFFIELANNADYEIDVSKWVLSSGDKTFVLPRNSAILAKKKMMLSPKITNFTIADEKNLKLSTGAGQLVFDYGGSLLSVPVVVQKSDSIVAIANTSKVSLPVKSAEALLPQAKPPVIPTENLSAAAISSDAILEEGNNKNSYIPTLISVILIGVSAGAVYFIRSKNIISKAGDDFKILDE